MILAASLLLFNVLCPVYIAWVLGSGWVAARVAGGTRRALYWLAACFSAIILTIPYFFLGICLVHQSGQPPYFNALLAAAAISLVLGILTAVILIDVSARFHARRILSGIGR